MKSTVQFKCMNETCKAIIFAGKCQDGIRCPECGGPVIQQPFNQKKQIVPLLTIELQDESSVPKVIYKGEEVKGKRNIFFDWDTDTYNSGGLTYAIEHIDSKDEKPGITRIERRVKGHASD